ncbi:MAG TPA: hypothetical protein VIV11_01840 [Kofleriaceae bacterium]
MAASGIAQAGGQAGSLGVGAEFQLSGLGGASLNYDAGDFHVGGFLGFDDDDGADNTIWSLGARFYYHVHSTAMSDFGVGGSLGIVSFPEMGGPDPDRLTGVFLEPGVQLRVFLAANVAISAATGVSLGVVDASGVVISGQVITGGIHYYFF